MMDLPFDSEDPDDVEVGANVWSNTHQDSGGFIGGCVIGVDQVARTVRVMRHCEARRGPNWVDLSMDALDNELTTFETHNAGVVAQQLFTWLGNASAKVRSGASEWAQLAVQLQQIKDAASYTPGAEARFAAHVAAKRSAS